MIFINVKIVIIYTIQFFVITHLGKTRSPADNYLIQIDRVFRHNWEIAQLCFIPPIPLPIQES
jgi:hypothetical protein